MRPGLCRRSRPDTEPESSVCFGLFCCAVKRQQHHAFVCYFPTLKSLFVTLLILAGVFAAYDFYLARPWERVIFEKGPRPAATVNPVILDHVVEDDGPIPVATTKPAEAATKPADNWQPSIPKIPTNEFVAPAIQSVETITKNWTMIPKQAFPRSVILKKDVQVKMSVGAATLSAGATAHARAFDTGVISVAPTETSTARGAVAVMDTDFPDQIHVSYEKWKVARIEQSRQAWLAGKTKNNSVVKDNSTMANGVGVSFGADGKPGQNADGSYNLLLAVISAGKVSDVDPKKVVSWGKPEMKTVDGKPTWVIDVRYEAKTIFGLMEVNSHAHVRDGSYVRWVYDSGEPLP